MEIRDATADDADAIRSIARSSMTSYEEFLDEDIIDAAVEQWYGDTLLEDIEADHTCYLVATDDENETVAFSQSELVGEESTIGRILWLHVDPEHRGEGTGVRLLARTREELRDLGADSYQGVVLEDNEPGNEFYENHGFERVGEREVEIGEKTYTENVFVGTDIEADEQWETLEAIELESETVYVSYGEADRGAKAPFYAAYETETGEQRYGWFCGSCNSVDNAMDAMGRVECNVCGNRRKATRWDASYL